VRLANLGSFSRTPQISKSFELQTPRLLASTSGLRGQLKQKVIFFLGKRIILPLTATHIKLIAIVIIAFHYFSFLPSHLSLPSPFTAQ
jgi:hypothetical protein